MNEQAVHQVAMELGAVVDAAAADPQLQAHEIRRVLRFVARVAHVVEQALQDVYGLAIEIKYLRPGDRDEIERLRRELDMILVRSQYSKAEEICSRLHHLRKQFEEDVALLLRCSRGDERWRELFWLLDEREGRIIQLVQHCTSSMSQQLEIVSRGTLASRDVVESADVSSRAVRAAIAELREIRDQIFGLSGQAGFIELTETDPDSLHARSHQLCVSIVNGNVYNTELSGSTVGAVAVGDEATARGHVAGKRPRRG